LGSKRTYDFAGPDVQCDVSAYSSIEDLISEYPEVATLQGALGQSIKVLPISVSAAK